jgi:PhnB protein
MKAPVTYLNFDGNTRDAMKFYARCLGGELSVMPFSEAPGDFPKDAKDKVMHAKITKNGATVLMASDALAGHGAPFRAGNNFSISLDCESLDEIERLFAAFGENGKIAIAAARYLLGCPLWHDHRSIRPELDVQLRKTALNRTRRNHKKHKWHKKAGLFVPFVLLVVSSHFSWLR